MTEERSLGGMERGFLWGPDPQARYCPEVSERGPLLHEKRAS